MEEHILLHLEGMLVYNMDYKMTTRKRKIFINNLILIASIGVYEQEKKIKQKIIKNWGQKIFFFGSKKNFLCGPCLIEIMVK